MKRSLVKTNLWQAPSMLAAVGSMLLAVVMWGHEAGAQTSADSDIALEFCDFVPYEYTFDLFLADGTRRQTASYRILEVDGIKVLEKKQEEELVQPMAIPRATLKRTLRSLAALPDLRPISTRLVKHEWIEKDGDKDAPAWSTEKIEVKFSGESVRRTVKGSHRETEERTRTLPPGLRQSEMAAAVFAHSAGPRPLATMRVAVYDAETDKISEIDWALKGQDPLTVTVLGQEYRAWAVRVGADANNVSYFRADRPRLFLGADRIDQGKAIRYYKLVRLWSEGSTPAAPCKTSATSSRNHSDVALDSDSGERSVTINPPRESGVSP